MPQTKTAVVLLCQIKMQSTPANNENQWGLFALNFKAPALIITWNHKRYCVWINRCSRLESRLTKSECCSSPLQIFTLWFNQTLLNPDSQNSNVTDRPPSSPQYLPSSSCRSVTQVLRLAVDLDVVDAAIEGLRGAIRAGSQTRGHHLRRHTWKRGRRWEKEVQ